MSYDLTLFRPPPGLDPLDAYHRIEREEEGAVAGALEPQQVAAMLRSTVPSFTLSELTGADWIELDHDTQVQVVISRQDVGISMPYFRKGLDEMMAVVGACIERLAEAGFVAFDPQLDKIVTPTDFGVMTAQYRNTDHILPHLVQDSQRRRATGPAVVPSKPWWKFW